jgi:hypothetical protein
MTSDTEEVPLSGGMITSGVVRVGATVRRPTGEHSSFVHDLLLHFEASGVDGVPRYLGLDEHGREILTFVAGDTTTEFKERDWSLEQITAAARLLRRLHDATAGTTIAGGAEVVCHNDFTPMNVVFADGLPVGVFDFDQARPGERLRDLAYAAWIWLLGAAVDDRLERQLVLLRGFLDAYGVPADQLHGFGARIATRIDDERRMHDAAGRHIPPGSWLHQEIDWLRARADDIDRGLALR